MFFYSAGMEKDKQQLQEQCSRLSQQHATLEARAKQLQETVMSQQDFEKKLKDFHEMVTVMQDMKAEGAAQKERLAAMESELDQARLIGCKAEQGQAASEAEIRRLRSLLDKRHETCADHFETADGAVGHAGSSGHQTDQRLQSMHQELELVKRDLASKTGQLTEARRLLSKVSSTSHRELAELASESRSRAREYWSNSLSNEGGDVVGQVERFHKRVEQTNQAVNENHAVNVKSDTRGSSKSSLHSIEVQALQAEKKILMDRIRGMERDVLMNR